jgi:hypothetical protein
VAYGFGCEPEGTLAANPVPADGATEVEPQQVLGWGAAFGVASYDLYLGTDRAAVLAAGNSSAEFQGNFTTTTFTPPRPLDEDTTYYWRVDTRNVVGTMRGEQWSFTTREPTFAPFFYGLRSAVAVGPAAVRLDWEAATDDVDAPEAIVYRVYASDNAGGQDFTRPVVTTSPGATSAIITAADFAGLTPGGAAYFVVRAVDTFGQEDNNTVELSVTLMAAEELVYVDATAADGGTGSFAAPYDSIQAGVDAVETAGAGTVLVATGTYAETVTLGVAGSGPIVVIGGFPTFSSLDDDDEVAILGHYAPRDHLVTLNGDALTLTAGQGLITIANGGRPTRLAGLTFTESPGYGIQALDANLEVLDCHFTDGDGTSGYTPLAGISFDTSSIAESYRLTVVGSEFDSTAGGIKVGGALAGLRVEGNNFHDLMRGTAVSAVSGLVGSVPLPSSSGIIVPTGGTQRIVFTSNRVEQTETVLDLGFQAEAPSMSGSLDVEISNNDILHSSGAFIALGDLQFFGDGGSAHVRIVNNSCLGADDEMVALDFSTSLLGVNDVPDGDVTIEIRENQFFHGNSDNIYIRDINTAPGGTTTITVEDNTFSHMEDDSVYLSDIARGEAGNNAGGTLNVNIRNNRSRATESPVAIHLGPPPEGVLNVVVQDNDFGSNLYELIKADFTSINGTAASGPASAEVNIWIVGNSGISNQDGMDLSLRPMGGPTRAVIAGNTIQSNVSSGISLSLLSNGALEGELDLAVYNNVLNDTYYEAFELTNGLDLDESLNLYFASNSGLGGIVGNALELNSHPGTLGLVAHNEVGLTGSNSYQAFVIPRRWGSPMRSIGSWMIRNNIFANASGNGIYTGGWAQVVNNTIVRNGQRGYPETGLNSHTLGSFSQVFVSNSIVWGNGDSDLDQAQLIRGSYTFVGDEAEAGGFMNLFGDPLFTRDENIRNFTDYYSLAPSSPAIDAGDPRAFFNDPDGSRNDMGAFGGPGAGALGWRGPTARLPLEVIGVRPLNQLYDGGRLHDPALPLTVVLTKTPAEASVTASNVVVTDASGSAVAGSLAVAGPRIVWTPDSDLTPAQWYTLTVSDLTDQDGGDQRSPFRLSFATAPTSGTAETEPNDDHLTASDTIISGGVFSFTGTSEIAGAADCYVVAAEAGDRLRATVFAQRGGLSTGDYLLRLTESDGTTVINENDASFGLDPYIDHLFESAGTYYLLVVGGELDNTYELAGCVEAR